MQQGTDGADQAWTAPIWIVAAGDGEDVHPPDDDVPPPGPAPHPEEFVWSQNSEVYHLAECAVVRQLRASAASGGEVAQRVSTIDRQREEPRRIASELETTVRTAGAAQGSMR